MQTLKVTMRWLLHLCVWVCFSAHVAYAATLQGFNANSLASIAQANHGKPYVLLFWSMDCPYCIDEMKAMKAALTGRQALKIITVCVDESESSVVLNKVLDQANIPLDDRWQFAEDDSERLRYTIDATWQGELPRSYFYDREHRVKAWSGKPSVGWFSDWIKTNVSP